MELKFFRSRYGHFWENMDNVLILLLFHSRESLSVFTSDLMVKLPVLILKHVSLYAYLMMDSTIAVSLYICKYISIIDNDINEDKTLAICFYVDLKMAYPI
jgi:hypothetical protein